MGLDPRNGNTTNFLRGATARQKTLLPLGFALAATGAGAAAAAVVPSHSQHILCNHTGGPHAIVPALSSAKSHGTARAYVGGSHSFSCASSRWSASVSLVARNGAILRIDGYTGRGSLNISGAQVSCAGDRVHSRLGVYWPASNTGANSSSGEANGGNPCP
jgi:hypothetical protein